MCFLWALKHNSERRRLRVVHVLCRIYSGVAGNMPYRLNLVCIWNNAYLTPRALFLMPGHLPSSGVTVSLSFDVLFQLRSLLVGDLIQRVLRSNGALCSIMWKELILRHSD